MKTCHVFLSIVAASLCLLCVSKPAQAQWTAQTPVEVAGHLKFSTNVVQGTPTLTGAVSYGTNFFYVLSGASGTGTSTNFPEGSSDHGDQWTQDYIWSGGGTAPNFSVDLAIDITGSDTASGSAMASSSSSADVYGKSTDSTQSGYSNSYTKTLSVNAAAPRITITMEAKANGRVYYAPSASFSGQADAQIVPGSPY